MDNWKVLSKTHRLKTHILDLYQVEALSPEGKQGHFDVVECLDWVNIMALTPNREVILVRQYRHGTNCQTLEFPGGAINSGEEPLIGAKREFLEETGYAASEWIFLGKSEVNPAFLNNSCHYYLALNCQKTSEQNLDNMEEIEIELKPLSKLKSAMEKGEISHALVHAAVAFYLLKGLPL